MIEVRPTGEDAHRFTFEVCVREGSTETRHDVTLGRAEWTRLAATGESPRGFVERCFEFLLEREPKESILRRFDVSLIARYFPEFEGAIRR